LLFQPEFLIFNQILLFLHWRSPDVSGNADNSECSVSRIICKLPDMQAAELKQASSFANSGRIMKRQQALTFQTVTSFCLLPKTGFNYEH
jgi:hypothetical protein